MFKKLVLLAFMLLYFSACDNISYTSEGVTMSYMPKLVTITYDSCEYVIGADSYNSAVLAHKGNCKFCKQRRDEEKRVEEFKGYVKNILLELRNNP
jgi:hypothetical protein